MQLHYGDLTDSSCLVKLISKIEPTEIYNLGAQSHVKVVIIFFSLHSYYYLTSHMFTYLFIVIVICM